MSVPIVFLGQGFINAVIEVLVVREEDMTADIIQLLHQSAKEHLALAQGQALTKPSLVTSVEARPPGVSLESMIIHDGPF